VKAAVFLKELNFKSASPTGLSNAFRMIKELQKRHKQHEAERKEREVGFYSLI
jgi:nucleosome binding factor SPN SPT16 subunit